MLSGPFATSPDPHRLTAPLTPSVVWSHLPPSAARSLRQSPPPPPAQSSVRFHGQQQPPAPNHQGPPPDLVALPRSRQIYRVPLLLRGIGYSVCSSLLMTNLFRIWICAGDAAAPQRTRCLTNSARVLSEFWCNSESAPAAALVSGSIACCLIPFSFLFSRVQRQGLARRRRRRTCGTSMS